MKDPDESLIIAGKLDESTLDSLIFSIHDILWAIDKNGERVRLQVVWVDTPSDSHSDVRFRLEKPPETL